jgi:indole-3-glycerol phosphate synthase
MSILRGIIGHKKEELKTLKGHTRLIELKQRAADAEARRDFESAIRRTGGEPSRLIAEIKKASPSKGLIRENFSLPEIVSVYDKKRVAAISVLTDERFFAGKIDYLKAAREMTGKPLLRKDFIIDEYQVYESRVYGADALLLIVAALDGSQLADLLGRSQENQMASLVEVHSMNELEVALGSGAKIIGINNRNLNTLDIDMRTTFELAGEIPADRIIVSESGIHSRADVRSIESAGVDAILVGTTLMQADDMGRKIDELMGHESRS